MSDRSENISVRLDVPSAWTDHSFEALKMFSVRSVDTSEQVNCDVRAVRRHIQTGWKRCRTGQSVYSGCWRNRRAIGNSGLWRKRPTNPHGWEQLRRAMSMHEQGQREKLASAESSWARRTSRNSAPRSSMAAVTSGWDATARRADSRRALRSALSSCAMVASPLMGATDSNVTSGRPPKCAARALRRISWARGSWACLERKVSPSKPRVRRSGPTCRSTACSRTDARAGRLSRTISRTARNNPRSVLPGILPLVVGGA